MTNEELIDYGRDIIRYKGSTVSLLSLLILIKKEFYSLSLKSDVENGDYQFIPNGPQHHVLFVRAQEQEVDFVYTSPNGREENSELLQKINSFFNQEIEVLQR